MNRSQWVLMVTLAATFYGVGNIWMTELGWRLWPYVAPADFDSYHKAWWAMIKPVVFPVAAVAFFGAFALIWWRPTGVSSGARCSGDDGRRRRATPRFPAADSMRCTCAG